MRPSLHLAAAAALLLAAGPGLAADRKTAKVRAACGYGGDGDDETVHLGVASMEALETERTLGRAVGMKDVPDLYQGDVDNALAAIYDGRRVIIYNPDFLNLLVKDPAQKWEVWAVLAHEMGHHVNGHTLDAGGSGYMKELQADYYSGFVLAKLGSTRDQALSAMKALAGIYGASAASDTHPPISERLQEIAKGWGEGSGAGEKAPMAGADAQKAADEKAAAEAAAKKVKKGEFCCKESGYKMCVTEKAPVGDVCQCATGKKETGAVCK